MFDSSFRAFLIMAAALVISPGASMAVVMEMALQRGRFAALLTVVGINIANSSLALASMFGLSAVFHQWPSLLRAVSFGGAIYLTYLGLRALWRKGQVQAPSGKGRRGLAPAPASSSVVRGMLTNFLNPSVILFYMLLLPQFITAADPFFRRFLLLAAAHVAMSMLWLSAYALAVGTLSERMARPRVRRIMEILTGAVLVILGLRLALK
jgi:threonine/homoserine/homoserine lactone efflux protein